MPKQTIICQTCGQSFDADVNLSRAFCLYCGAANAVPARSTATVAAEPLALSADPATRRTQLEQIIAAGGESAAVARDRLLFWEARFESIGRHESRYGDKFMEFIATLNFYSKNYPSRGAMKRARKDRDHFLNRPSFLKAMAGAVQPQEMLFQEFYDTTELYLKACRDDKHYGSRLFDLVKLKDEDVAAKAAEEIAVGMMGYLCSLGMTPQTDLLVQALHQAYPAIFTQFPDLLDEAIARLPTEVRAMLYRVIARAPGKTEEST